MDDVNAVTRTPVTFDIGGGSYILHPLTFRDFGKIDQYGREELLRATRRSLADEEARRLEMAEEPLTESEKRIQWAEAYDACARISVLTAQGRAFLTTSEGLMRVIWLSMRKENKTMTVDQCEALLPVNAGDAGDIQTEIMIISGLIDRKIVNDPEALKKLRDGESGNAPAAEA